MKIIMSRSRKYFVLLLIFIFSSPLIFSQDKIKIAIWGDSRENLDGATERITSILLKDITDWDIQIHTGDFTHAGLKKDWQRSLNYKGMKKLFKRGKILMCTSNHDAGSPIKRSTYDKFTKGVLPINVIDSTTHFSYCHKGNVHIVLCDPYFTDSLTMQTWLAKTLQDVPKEDWLIGVWHSPSYTDLSYKESHLQQSLSWLNILAEHGGDFVLNGHAHIYVRSNPLSPNGDINMEHGIVHIINGTGGATWEDSVKQNSKIAFTPKSRSFPCITFLTFEKNNAHLQTIDARPESKLKVIDDWTWTR